MRKLLKDFDIKIGKRVRDYRISQNIRQDKLAEYLGLPKQSVTKLEQGKRRLNIDELEKIALFFDKPMEFFIQEDYKYLHPIETPYGGLPIFMEPFLEEVRYALGIDIYEKMGKKMLDTFKKALDAIYREVQESKKFKKIKESKKWKIQ